MSTKTYRMRFRPSAEVFVQGTNPVNLLNELRELGMCKVVAQTEAIPCLEDYEPRANYTYWDVILTTNCGINAIQDVFMFVKDIAEVKIEVIDEEGSLKNEMSVY
jgi:two-component system chemotaxis sensor kinase CheA